MFLKAEDGQLIYGLHTFEFSLHDEYIKHRLVPIDNSDAPLYAEGTRLLELEKAPNVIKPFSKVCQFLDDAGFNYGSYTDAYFKRNGLAIQLNENVIISIINKTGQNPILRYVHVIDGIIKSDDGTYLRVLDLESMLSFLKLVVRYISPEERAALSYNRNIDTDIMALIVSSLPQQYTLVRILNIIQAVLKGEKDDDLSIFWTLNAYDLGMYLDTLTANVDTYSEFLRVINSNPNIKFSDRTNKPYH